VLDLWLRARGHRPGALLDLEIRAQGASRARGTLRSVRCANPWQGFSLELDHDGSPLAVVVRGSGNAAFDRSVENAVHKASPLPLPPDPTLFEHYREIEFLFNPQE
jgi:colicin import membrane protein